MPIFRYASGNFAKNILWHSAEVYTLFIFTDLAGLAPGTASTLILISLVWDALLDPIIGIAADRVKKGRRKYGPFLFVGAPLCTLSFILMFSLPTFMNGDVSLGLCVLLLFRSAYSLVDLPHNALIANISDDADVRTRISTARFLFSSVASLCLSLSLPYAFSDGSPIELAPKLSTYSVAVGITACVVILWSYSSVSTYDRQKIGRRIRITYTTTVRDIGSNHAFSILLISGGITMLMLPMFSKSVIYLAKYVYQNPLLSGHALIALTIGQILGIPLWTKLAQQFEKHHALICAHLTVTAAFSAAFLLTVLAPHPTATTLIVFPLISGIGVSGVYSLLWALLPDAIDAGELASDTRHEGTYFGVLILVLKGTSALGSWFLGVALETSGYVADATQSISTTNTISAFSFVLPATGSLLSILALQRYRITRRMHRENTKALLARRESQQSV